jgi:hypothetical protein
MATKDLSKEQLLAIKDLSKTSGREWINSLQRRAGVASGNESLSRTCHARGREFPIVGEGRSNSWQGRTGATLAGNTLINSSR